MKNSFGKNCILASVLLVIFSYSIASNAQVLRHPRRRIPLPTTRFPVKAQKIRVNFESHSLRTLRKVDFDRDQITYSFDAVSSDKKILVAAVDFSDETIVNSHTKSMLIQVKIPASMKNSLLAEQLEACFMAAQLTKATRPNVEWFTFSFLTTLGYNIESLPLKEIKFDYTNSLPTGTINQLTCGT
ncbi:MAG: hypothetical protein ISR65_14535 [Bacteriovoracaceae bacterium]|nr:hypothetical protein [Bacteriovoracaceae bacterium]